MNPYFDIMPVDKTKIRTCITLHPDLRTDPESFIRKNDLPIRTVKQTRGMTRHGPSWNLTLDVLTYKGVQVKLITIDDDPLASATIDFNPGVCLYGHNGRILTLTGFLHALALLVTHLKPLLEDPDDWVDLIPGVRRGGFAYWSYLEVLSHHLDPDGALLARLRHLRHPSITTPSRHWPTSIEVGGRKAMLQLSIYMKAVEMVAHGKLPDLSPRPLEYQGVLRLEARMRDKKLILYFGNEHNVETIDGKERLVSFYPRYLIGGHRAVFSVLKGVFQADGDSVASGKREQLEPMGQLLAQVARDTRTKQTFPDLLFSLKGYTEASSETIGKIRDAGLAELSRSSTISSGDIFSDTAYRTQIGIASNDMELKVVHEMDDTLVHQKIAAAYRPPGQPFRPLTQLPGYHRI